MHSFLIEDVVLLLLFKKISTYLNTLEYGMRLKELRMTIGRKMGNVLLSITLNMMLIQ